MIEAPDAKKIKIYYDGGCPFCARYVAYLNFKKTFGQPNLVDVRNNLEAFTKIKDLGYDIDQGMVVEIGDKLYYGGDAIHVMSFLSTPSGIFNKLNKMVFSSMTLSRILYPILKFGRNTALSLIGNKTIAEQHSPKPHDVREDAFAVFAFAWATYSLLNFFYMVWRGIYYVSPNLDYVSDGITPITILVPILAGILTFFPRSRQIFALLIAAQASLIYFEMPLGSNHYIMHAFFVVGAALAGLYFIIKKGNFLDYFDAIAPYGRSLLIIMYTFGIFHKINTDFLNPEVSCAVALWREFSFPAFIADSKLMHYTAIYGTFAFEGFAMLALMTQRWRYLGILCGVAFHSFIGFNHYGHYTAFSSLALALHTLFLPREALSGFKNSRIWREVTNDPKFYKPLFKISFLVFLSLLSIQGLSIYTRFYEESPKLTWILWPIYCLPYLGFIFMAYASQIKQNKYPALYFIPKNALLFLMTSLFFFTCITPYLGLKTRQSINMFANLRLEGGISNHLILPNPPGPFKYLEDIVEVVDGSDFEIPNEYAYVYYEFLNLIDTAQKKEGTITYKRNGVLHENVSYETLKSEIDKTLHPLWFRKVFHFTSVQLTEPKKCSREN